MTRPVDLIICFAGPALRPSNKPLFPCTMSDIPTWSSKLQYKTGFCSLVQNTEHETYSTWSLKKILNIFICYLFMQKQIKSFKFLFQIKSTYLNLDLHHFRSFGTSATKWPDLNINLIDNDDLQPSCCKIAKCWLSIL